MRARACVRVRGVCRGIRRTLLESVVWWFTSACLSLCFSFRFRFFFFLSVRRARRLQRVDNACLHIFEDLSAGSLSLSLHARISAVTAGTDGADGTL